MNLAPEHVVPCSRASSVIRENEGLFAPRETGELPNAFFQTCRAIRGGDAIRSLRGSHGNRGINPFNLPEAQCMQNDYM